MQAYAADAAEPARLSALIDEVVGDFGGLDVLVNNAGTFSSGTIGEIAADEYERVRRINLDAVFALTNAAVRVMPPGSRIVNISSVLGERASGPGMSVYNASKFAVTGFSRSWAKDLGPRGILVNAVQPGPIDTELNPADGEHAEHMRRQTALGRYGRPEEVAAATSPLTRNSGIDSVAMATTESVTARQGAAESHSRFTVHLSAGSPRPTPIRSSRHACPVSL